MRTIWIGPATVFDYFSTRPSARVRVRARRGRRRTAASCGSRSRRATTRHSKRASACRRPSELLVDWDTVSCVARRGDGARDAGAHRRRPGGRSTSGVSRRSSSPAACKTGSRRSVAAASAATRWSSSRTRPGRAERTIELLADYEIFAVPMERADGRARRGRARRHRPSEPRLPPAGSPAPALGRDRRLRGRAQGSRAPQVGDAHVPVRLPRPQGRRPRRPYRPRHRPVRRPQADRRRPRSAGVHGAPLRRRRQALRPGRTARPRAEVHRRGAPRARSPGRHDLGEGQDARQEGDARHGRGAAQALRRAQGRARATRSAPTRTGSRSSRTPSSGS